jgi:hypothetical protein
MENETRLGPYVTLSLILSLFKENWSVSESVSAGLSVKFRAAILYF